MKKQVLILVMMLFVLGAQAYGGNNKAVNPKPINYQEVVSKLKYPQDSKEKGIEGRVVVTLKVDTEGNVISHRFESYPCSDLKEAVEKVVENLKFEPARNANGEVVIGRIAVPFNFKLTI